MSVAIPDPALVLDISGVNFLGEGFRALVSIGQQCQQPALQWALITSDAVNRLLRIADSTQPLRTANSVEEHFGVPDVLVADG